MRRTSLYTLHLARLLRLASDHMRNSVSPPSGLTNPTTMPFGADPVA